MINRVAIERCNNSVLELLIFIALSNELTISNDAGLASYLPCVISLLFSVYLFMNGHE